VPEAHAQQHWSRTEQAVADRTCGTSDPREHDLRKIPSSRMLWKFRRSCSWSAPAACDPVGAATPIIGAVARQPTSITVPVINAAFPHVPAGPNGSKLGVDHDRA
jgi:hypothetical protein